MVLFSEKLKRCGQVVEIPVNSIKPNPNQPRKHFEWGNLEELAQSIYQNGLLQPITVRELFDGKFELIAGERRLRACKMAGLSVIPSIVVSVSDEKSAVLAVMENLQRQDLHFFEQAMAISALARDFGMDRERIARKLGKSPSAIANKLRLLKLPVEIQKKIVKCGLTERHARALLRLTDFELMDEVVNAVCENSLNVAETDILVSKLLESPQEESPAPPKPKKVKAIKDVKIVLNTLDKAVASICRNGIKATATHKEKEDCIEYLICIHR